MPPGRVPGPASAVAGSAVEVLARCRELVRPGLVEAVGRLDPWTGEMAAYALGWRDMSGDPDPAASEGKGLRQALAVLSAEAVGADGKVAGPAAVAVELVHAFSLVHDDIMDGDPVRRRRAAVWRSYGVGPAVLAGDALHALAVRSLAETPGDRAPSAVRRLCLALTVLVRGQADDLRFESLPWSGPTAVGPAGYRVMVEHKTGSLLGCAAALGAELGEAPAETVTALDRAGRHLGISFQIVDDLLGIWGDPQVTGKPVHSDLRQRKKTYPVLAALTGNGPAARELAVLLEGTEPLEGAAASRAALLVDEAGGRAAARAEAREQLNAARACLDGIRLDPVAVRELELLVGFLLDRTS
ncbi:polyprenyl synthetase family protein [Streptomyces nodosus]